MVTSGNSRDVDVPADDRGHRKVTLELRDWIKIGLTFGLWALGTLVSTIIIWQKLEAGQARNAEAIVLNGAAIEQEKIERKAEIAATEQALSDRMNRTDAVTNAKLESLESLGRQMLREIGEVSGKIDATQKR